MKNLFSIGEMSKLQNISRQTLIFYVKKSKKKPFQQKLRLNLRRNSRSVRRPRCALIHIGSIRALRG